MILDGHIHVHYGEVDRAGFHAALKKSGIDGGIVLSLPPASFYKDNRNLSYVERLDNLYSWTGDHSGLYPFFWIDPLEQDALEQVAFAYKRGVKGFKVICSHFYPGDEKALEVYKAIAGINRPILFHSGILWDGQPSSKFNRPAEFEALLEIDGLRFALAHISWPWYDENIAVYGKFQHAHSLRPGLTTEMFIDTTPGTPPIYREDALTKLFTVGYNVSDNVFFGTDCLTIDYSCSSTAEWIGRDNEIYRRLGIERDVIEKIYSKNLIRFVEGK